MVNDRAVEFFTGADASAHLEKHHGIRAVGHRLIADEPHITRAFQEIIGLPVSHAGGLLHEHEGSALLQAAHQVMAHGNQRRRIGGIGIIVPGHHIHISGPFLVIESLIEAH